MLMAQARLAPGQGIKTPRATEILTDFAVMRPCKPGKRCRFDPSGCFPAQKQRARETPRRAGIH